MNIGEDEHAIMHYGILRKSGRYPWGSGETPHERAGSFLSTVKELRDQGLTDKQIADGFGMTTSQLRDTVTIARNAEKAADISRARRLKEAGNSNVAIGRIMGKPESTIRNLLKDDARVKNEILKSTSEMLRAQVQSHGYIDVGKGTELLMGVSAEKLKAARRILEDEGYKLHYVDVEQLGTGKMTKLKVLSKPGTTFKEVWDNRDKIVPAQLKSRDGGLTYEPRVLPPLSISSKRVKVRYAEEGGSDADGVIYVRRGVKDVSLGKANYAQVRIAVDGSHYLKGMAMYNDDMPPGVDLVFNTNKSSTGNKLDAMKKMKDDPDDPFGANINDQIHETGPDGKRRVTSVMNIVNQEGKWDTWSKTLSSQMLSKQKPALIQEQLDLAYEGKKTEFDRIMSLTNPTVKKHLLEKFADSADASAVHLKAAHMPRQANKVILPVNSLKDHEVYAPTFNDGERVVLVRFPHGGIFEIPELTVNNRHRDARRLIGTDAIDAIGINSRVAERLSGADFDGDTVLVIPNNHGKIQTHPALKQLEGFDPKSAYPAYEGMPQMTPKQKGREMGDVSNLITDMTVKGAPFEEIARAVKHSMVVIDAEKHNLNYRQSAIDNGIPALKKKYQGGANKGAATLISRATSDKRVNDRKLRSQKDGGPIDRETGKLVYVETGAEYSPGKPKKIKSTKLAETDDAHTLIDGPGTRRERIYADHSNRLKELANQARREFLGIKGLEYSPSAAKAYEEDVKDLNAALNNALRNAPYERQAQILGNAVFRQKKEANPDLDAAELKKLKSKSLQDARVRVGAKKQQIEITPRQWEAIQAGAISNSKLEQILDNTDIDRVKELATPKDKKVMDSAMQARAMRLIRSNKYTLAEVAQHLGISVSTLQAGLAGDEA
ncbi:helix-turn-helix DNA-binding domain protein [Streptomyces phage Kardashian]|nr:helix-turn-helix DNA-binding domain protein [Streptomyces phage Kardashian]